MLSVLIQEIISTISEPQESQVYSQIPHRQTFKAIPVLRGICKYCGYSNAITATDSAEVDSDTKQSNTQNNDCGFATDCFNTGGNTNVETASGDSELTTDNDLSNKEGNTCESLFAIIRATT